MVGSPPARRSGVRYFKAYSTLDGSWHELPQPLGATKSGGLGVVTAPGAMRPRQIQHVGQVGATRSGGGATNVGIAPWGERLEGPASLDVGGCVCAGAAAARPAVQRPAMASPRSIEKSFCIVFMMMSLVVGEVEAA
jgi:hypothetical protein